MEENCGGDTGDCLPTAFPELERKPGALTPFDLGYLISNEASVHGEQLEALSLHKPTYH